MRHVAIFLSMVKGKLGGAGPAVYPFLAADRGEVAAEARDRFLGLCRRFARHPAKVAIVTSSIRYEAEIVLGEVLRVCREQLSAWPVAGAVREELCGLFGTIDSLYDAFITASDSSEIRLKPHRDLYALALQRLGLDARQYPAVLGLEDSTAGVTAIKAAGCGLCVAVPFEATAQHDFGCADHVVRGGLGELMLDRGCFLPCCS
jgi:hypothetical protein